jgi:DNA primase
MEIAEVIEKLNLPYSINAVDQKGELWMPCPLPFGNHKNGDKNPSFSINLKNGKCYCFTCGGGGDLVWLVSSLMGTSFEDAKLWLKDMEVGIEDDDEFKKRIREKLRLQQLSQSFSEISQQIFSEDMIPEDLPYHPWLASQGISESTARYFKIFYDKKKDVIAFPHFWEGDLVGMQFRNLGHSFPKYYNTPNFPKKNTLFNYDRVNNDDAIVVESPKTAIVMHEQGYSNTIATFGASVNEEQLSYLRKFKTLYLWPDNDEPGKKALLTEIKLLKDYVDIMIVPPVNIPKGDAADIDRELIPEYLLRAQTYLRWKLYEKVY